MKTYEQVIDRVADAGFHTIMSGSMNSPYYGQDLGMIAFIYGKTGDAVYEDANKKLKQIQDEQYRKFRLTHS
jgi:hypothetical protein